MEVLLAQMLLAVAMKHHPHSYPANLKALLWSKSLGETEEVLIVVSGFVLDHN